MKKSLLLLICVLPVFTAASSHHTLSYELDDKDVDCMIWAGLRIDLQGRCYDDAIYAMKQKIIKSGKMSRAQLDHYLKPYETRCTKQVIKDLVKTGIINPDYFQDYRTYYVNDCLADEVYTLYRKLGLKHKPASPAKLYEYNHPK
mgnify:CR=1 FL=1